MDKKKEMNKKRLKRFNKSSIHIEKAISKALTSKVDNTEQILVSLAARNIKFKKRTEKRQMEFQHNSLIKILLNDENGGWKQVAQTDVQRHTVNPDYATDLIFDFVFEMRQIFRIELYQVVRENDEYFLGSEIFQLSKLMGNPDCIASVEIFNKRFETQGHVILRYERVVRENDSDLQLKINLTGENLTNFGFFKNKIKPIIKIYRSLSLREDSPPDSEINKTRSAKRRNTYVKFLEYFEKEKEKRKRGQTEWREIYSSEKPAMKMTKREHKFETISLTKEALVDPEAPDSPIKVPF